MQERKALGFPTPAIDTRPVLKMGLDFYLLAYDELRYDRPVGMTVGAIPWSSVERWAKRNGIHQKDDFDVLLSHIRSMENAAYEFKDRREKSKVVSK